MSNYESHLTAARTLSHGAPEYQKELSTKPRRHRLANAALRVRRVHSRRNVDNAQNRDFRILRLEGVVNLRAEVFRS